MASDVGRVGPCIARRRGAFKGRRVTESQSGGRVGVWAGWGGVGVGGGRICLLAKVSGNLSSDAPISGR